MGREHFIEGQIAFARRQHDGGTTERNDAIGRQQFFRRATTRRWDILP